MTLLGAFGGSVRQHLLDSFVTFPSLQRGSHCLQRLNTARLLVSASLLAHHQLTATKTSRNTSESEPNADSLQGLEGQAMRDVASIALCWIRLLL